MQMLQIALSLALIGSTIKSMDQNVDITNLDRANVLQVLFDNAEPKGRGWMHYNPQQELSYEEAKAILDSKCSPANSYDNRIDYLYGRAIKVHLCPDRWNPNTLEVGIYNEYNGNSAAQRAIRGLRHKQLFKTIS